MSDDDKSLFHGGHTQALDIEAMEGNDVEEGWREHDKPKKSEWASDGWGAGDAFWPSEGGGHSGTQALDISEFDGSGGDPSPSPSNRNRRRRNPSDGWGSDFDRDDSESSSRRRDPSDGWGSSFDEPSGRRDPSDGWGSGFDDSSGNHTMALDEGELRAGSAGFGKEPVRPRRERVDDHRDRGERGPKKGKLSYEGGRSKDKDEWRGRRTKDSIPDDPDDGIEELAPHERTMAIDVNSVEASLKPKGRPKPKPPKPSRPMSGVSPVSEVPRTQALDVEELRASGPTASSGSIELAPHERTMALDISGPTPQLLGGSGSKPPGGPPPTQALDSISTDPSAGTLQPVPAPDLDVNKTSMIDPSELQNYQAREQDSGGRLVIFVEGSDPVEFRLRPGITSIGREHSNHLVLSDPYCSRKHLRIKRTETDFEVRSVGEDTQTLVNGEVVTEWTLSPGDEITVGSSVMRFVIGRPTPADKRWPVLPSPVSSPGPPSGNTAAVWAVNETPTPAPPPRRKRGASKLQLAILALLVVGSLVLLIIVLVAFYFSYRPLG